MYLYYTLETEIFETSRDYVKIFYNKSLYKYMRYFINRRPGEF